MCILQLSYTQTMASHRLASWMSHPQNGHSFQQQVWSIEVSQAAAWQIRGCGGNEADPVHLCLQ